MKEQKISLKEAKAILKAEKIDPAIGEQILEAFNEAAKNATPWWVIALKTVAYLIGLVLAGYGTTAAAQTFLPIM